MPKPRKSYALWMTGFVLRFLLTLIIFAVCFFLIWRVFISSNPPSGMKGLAPNGQLAAAYKAHGEELSLFTQEQATVTRGENNAGYFGVTTVIFIPEAEQLQVVMRYNNSTLKNIQKDFGLAERPPKGVEIFDATVVKVVDTTPDNKEDNVDGSAALSKIRIAPTASEVDTTSLYTYVRYTFDGVTVSEDTIAVFLDIYYEADVNYENKALGTLRLYHEESENLTVGLSGKEKKALENFDD